MHSSYACKRYAKKRQSHQNLCKAWNSNCKKLFQHDGDGWRMIAEDKARHWRSAYIPVNRCICTYFWLESRGQEGPSVFFRTAKATNDNFKFWTSTFETQTFLCVQYSLILSFCFLFCTLLAFLFFTEFFSRMYIPYRTNAHRTLIKRSYVLEQGGCTTCSYR